MNKKEPYFSIAEKEIIDSLQEIYGIGVIEATEQVLRQKRQAAYGLSLQGNFALAEHMLREINEWNDEVEAEMNSRGRLEALEGKDKEVKIILPGDE